MRIKTDYKLKRCHNKAPFNLGAIDDKVFLLKTYNLLVETNNSYLSRPV